MRDEHDPKGLIAEAYKMEGIGLAECRSIFLDWALGVPVDDDPVVAIAELLERHGEEGHPMTEVLKAGLVDTPRTGRRGGRAGRRS